MLIRFVIENFLSFGAPAEFSVDATRELHLRERTYAGGPDELRLLPVAALFGPNASGKSNLFRALQVLQRLVVEGVRPGGAIPVSPFRLDPTLRNSPTRFSIEFLAEGHAYAYEIELTSEQVLKESLHAVKASGKTPLFDRRAGAAQPEFTFGKTLSEGQAQDGQFLRFVGMGTRSNDLFLHQALDRSIAALKPVFSWFTHTLMLLDPKTVYPALGFHMAARHDFQSFCSDSIQRIGAGIESLEPEVLSLQESQLPERLRELALQGVTDTEGVLLGTPEGERYSVSKVDGELQVARVVSFHPGTDGKRVRFEFAEESDGTQRFIDLLPALYELGRPRSNRVVFVDELDRSLHSGLTRTVIESYLRSWQPSQATQFLFTTHDATLLDQDLFRRDEVWLLEKTQRGETQIRSLSDYRLRSDKRLMRDYLQGRFGAVPPTSRLLIRRNVAQAAPRMD